jgi:hypothetical protein
LPLRFRVAQQDGLSNAHSPFRAVEHTGREVEWINRYLDQERVRGVADPTLRSYQALAESTLLDYIRFQVNRNPPPAAESVNRRVGTAERAMRREFPEAARLCAPGFQN